MNDLIGRSLGPYQILEQLGQGGMATVFKAYHPAMDRYVAIKVLPRHMASDPQFRARFQREARTIAKLEQRYILPVHDTGEQDGVHYMVMRYTDGGTLSDLIAQGPPSIERVATLVAQVAEALGYAHRQGVIHRDIKPANILISREGDALLSDFGIARIIEGTMQLTGDGMLIGTPYYMAPEQVQGLPSDARTDIYALGVVLYEALAGRRPYEAETPLAVALMHVHNPLPPPRQLRPDLPEALERVILRAMAKTPADRFQTADEMAVALRAVGMPQAPRTAPMSAAETVVIPAEGTTINRQAVLAQAQPANTPSARRARWVLPVVIGGVLLLIVVAVVFRMRPDVADRRPQRSPLPGATTVAIEPTSELPPAAAESPPTAAVLPIESTPSELTFFTNTANSLSIALIGSQLWAATPGGLVRWENDQPRVYTSADGLPSTALRALISEPDGTLWLAGESSVTRIHPDGSTLGPITVYLSGSDLRIPYVRTFLREPDGAIVAGGNLASGLVRWEGESWSPYGTALTTDALGGIDGEITSMARTSDGALLIATNSGLVRLDGDKIERYSEEQGIGELAITQLLADRENHVWAAAGDRGLLRLNTEQNRWEQVTALNQTPVLQIYQVTDGALLAASFEWVARSTDGGATWSKSDADTGDFGYQPRVIAEAADGAAVWVGSSEGVALFANDTWKLLRPSGQLPDNSIGALQFHENQLYITGRYGSQIATLDPPTGKIDLLADSYGRALAFSEGSMWYGDSEGLFHRQGDTIAQLRVADGLPDDQIYALLATETTLWIGTRSGLTSLDLTTNKLGEPVPAFAGAAVETLYLAQDGTVWAGSTDDGDPQRPVVLGHYQDGNWQIWKHGEDAFLSEASGISALAEDSNGTLWLALWGAGLWQQDGADWKQAPAASNRPEGAALAMATHGDAMWVVGQFGALYRWDGTGWERIEVAGLPNQVNSIAFGEGETIWLGTSEGLVRYR